jgi:O-antigen/teichoic acid export membrane protein
LSQTVKGRILKGIGASSFGQVVNLVIQLVGLPVFLSVWGVEKYGEWLLLTSITSYLAMSDIGFATAAGNDMAMKVGAGDRQGALVVYQSIGGLIALLGLALLVLSAIALFGTPLVSIIPLQHFSSTTASETLLLLAASVVAGQLLAVLFIGFRCDGGFALGQWLLSGMRLIEFVAQVAILVFTGSIVFVALTSVVIRALAIPVFTAILKARSPWIVLGTRYFDPAVSRRLFIPALASMGMPLGHAIGLQGMLQIVAWQLGPVAVAIFAIHRTVANLVTQVSNVIANGIWPECSLAIGGNDFAIARLVHRKGCQWSLWLSLAAAMIVPSLMIFLLPWWTVGKVACDLQLMILLMVSVLLRACWWTSSVIPLSMNRHVGVAQVYILVSLAALALAWSLSLPLGILGIAVAVAAIDLIMACIVVPISLKLLDDQAAPFIKTVLGCPLIKAAPLPS